MNRQDAEFKKFVETSGGKVAIGLVLDLDSFNVFNTRYVGINTGTTIADLTETSNEAIQLNALLARLREAKLLSPTT